METISLLRGFCWLHIVLALGAIPHNKQMKFSQMDSITHEPMTKGLPRSSIKIANRTHKSKAGPLVCRRQKINCKFGERIENSNLNPISPDLLNSKDKERIESGTKRRDRNRQYRRAVIYSILQPAQRSAPAKCREHHVTKRRNWAPEIPHQRIS